MVSPMKMLIDQLFKFIFKSKILRQNEEEYDEKTPTIPIIMHPTATPVAKNPSKHFEAGQNPTESPNARVFHANETDTKSSKEKHVTIKSRIKRGKFKIGKKKGKARGA